VSTERGGPQPKLRLVWLGSWVEKKKEGPLAEIKHTRNKKDQKKIKRKPVSSEKQEKEGILFVKILNRNDRKRLKGVTGGMVYT